MRVVHTSIAGLAIMLSGSVLAANYDLPENTPARRPGLWEMVETGTVGPNKVRSVKRYCLDEKADRALQELEILRKELSVVHHDVHCEPPQFVLKGNVLTGDMACRTNSLTDSVEAGQDFHWTMVFDSDTEVTLERQATPIDVMLLLDIDLVEKQRWVGDCPAGQKPGDYIDEGFKYNSEAEPNEGRRDNIYESTRIVDKMLKEGKEINKRLGPM
ncbi:MAG: hypothetical protein QHC66_14055 [Pusillimonas sp.]|nr:hypothetical protein [Pusillimonas sp.]